MHTAECYCSRHTHLGATSCRGNGSDRPLVVLYSAYFSRPPQNYVVRGKYKCVTSGITLTGE